MAKDTENKVTLKSRFNKLDSDRQAVLDRARKCSELTIPSLLPPEGSDDNTEFTTPYQGLGAIGVNNLAAKLLLTLLPPNQPFFKLGVDDFTLQEFGDETRAEVEKSLNRIERAIFNEVETKAIRVPSFSIFKHLAVTGNIATYQPDEGGLRIFRLDQYVVERDSMGNLVEIIIKEIVSPLALPEEIRTFVLSQTSDSEESDDDSNKDVELYTQVKLNEDGTKWLLTQEVKGEAIPDSEGEYKLEDNPYQALRWSHDVGTAYGRGFVEEYLGDLLTLEALSKAITEDSVIASRTIFLVNPTGMTNAKKFRDAKNGDVIEGIPDDIGTAKVDRHSDLQLVLNRIATLEQRLSRAFLMFEAIQRDAERVTAEEIRRLAQELENSLGGVYSVLTQEFQLPLIKRIMKQMVKAKRIPELPKEVAEPKIVTGIDGLGRGNDLESLRMFADTGMLLGQETFVQSVQPLDFLTRVGTALGFDMDGLLKTQEMLQAENKEATSNQMMSSVLPEITKGMMAAEQPQEQIQQPQGGMS